MEHGNEMLAVTQFVTLIFLLLAGHFLADFPLQSDFIVKAKDRNHSKFLPLDQQVNFKSVWPWVLTGHAFIHGLMVFLCTRSIILAGAEVASHWIIDFGKCERWYNFNVDQCLHVLMKLIYVGILAAGVSIV